MKAVYVSPVLFPDRFQCPCDCVSRHSQKDTYTDGKFVGCRADPRSLVLVSVRSAGASCSRNRCGSLSLKTLYKHCDTSFMYDDQPDANASCSYLNWAWRR